MISNINNSSVTNKDLSFSDLPTEVIVHQILPFYLLDLSPSSIELRKKRNHQDEKNKELVVFGYFKADSSRKILTIFPNLYQRSQSYFERKTVFHVDVSKVQSIESYNECIDLRLSKMISDSSPELKWENLRRLKLTKVDLPDAVFQKYRFPMLEDFSLIFKRSNGATGSRRRRNYRVYVIKRNTNDVKSWDLRNFSKLRKLKVSKHPVLVKNIVENKKFLDTINGSIRSLDLDLDELEQAPYEYVGRFFECFSKLSVRDIRLLTNSKKMKRCRSLKLFHVIFEPEKHIETVPMLTSLIAEHVTFSSEGKIRWESLSYVEIKECKLKENEPFELILPNVRTFKLFGDGINASCFRLPVVESIFLARAKTNRNFWENLNSKKLEKVDLFSMKFEYECSQWNKNLNHIKRLVLSHCHFHHSFFNNKHYKKLQHLECKYCKMLKTGYSKMIFGRFSKLKEFNYKSVRSNVYILEDQFIILPENGYYKFDGDPKNAIGCFLNGTNVMTEDGKLMKIEKLSLHTKILSGRNEFIEVIEIIKHKTKKTVLNFNNGLICVTPHHIMIVFKKKEKIFKKAKDVCIGDLLLCIKKRRKSLIRINSISITEGMVTNIYTKNPEIVVFSGSSNIGVLCSVCTSNIDRFFYPISILSYVVFGKKGFKNLRKFTKLISIRKKII